MSAVVVTGRSIELRKDGMYVLRTASGVMCLGRNPAKVGFVTPSQELKKIFVPKHQPKARGVRGVTIDEKAVEAEYMSNKTIRAIADKYGVAESRVYSILRARGLVL